jgi:hypothetical protein
MLESGDYTKALSTFGDGTGARGRPEVPGSETDRGEHPLAGPASQEAKAQSLGRALRPLADRFNPNHLPAGPGGGPGLGGGQFTSAEGGGGGAVQSSPRAYPRRNRGAIHLSHPAGGPLRGALPPLGRGLNPMSPGGVTRRWAPARVPEFHFGRAVFFCPSSVGG